VRDGWRAPQSAVVDSNSIWRGHHTFDWSGVADSAVSRTLNAEKFLSVRSTALRNAKKNVVDTGRTEGGAALELKIFYWGAAEVNSAKTFDAMASTCCGVIFANTPPHADEVVLYVRSPNTFPSSRSV
jgi:hypothetical protein